MSLNRASFTGSLLAAGAAVPLAAVAQTAIPLRIGVQSIDSAAEPLYAQERGYFTKVGLAADVQVLNNGGAIVAAVASGALDVGFSNLFSFLPAYARGIPASLIAPAALHVSTSPAEAPIVRKDAAYRTGKDLNGKTIGVLGLKSITHVTAEAYIDADGGDSTSVKYLELPDSAMGPALLGGRVDAIAVAISDYADANAPGSPYRVLAYPYNTVAHRFLASGWIANRGWMQAQPDGARRFSTAILETARWANANQALSGAILMKYTKITPEQLVKLAKFRVTYGGFLNPALIDPVIVAAAKYGVIPAAFPAQNLYSFAPQHV